MHISVRVHREEDISVLQLTQTSFLCLKSVESDKVTLRTMDGKAGLTYRVAPGSVCYLVAVINDQGV